MNIAAYSDALVVLGTAGVVVPAVRRWGINPVLGYLGAGALLGPLGLGSFIGSLPLLYWVTVVDAKNVAGIAELGVVFLLFLIGLELSWERLLTMRRLVFGLGLAQVAATTTLLASIGALVGLTPVVAIILGASLALSSTAIVLDLLAGQGRLTTVAGRTSFSVLLAQDLAVIPVLMFVSVAGAQAEGSALVKLASALAQATIAVAVIVIAGRVLLRPLFRSVAGAQSSELFIAAILFVIVGSGVIAGVAGLSMAIGAFVAGLLLAETEYRKAIEATVDPFKGLLLGVFFFTIGMKIDARELLGQPLALALAVAGLVVLKAALIFGLARLFKVGTLAALETALLLGPGGEFAFVALDQAVGLGIIPPKLASFWLAVTALTMVLIPLLASAARRVSAWLAPATAAAMATALMVQPAATRRHAIVVGHGRVGRVVCSLLKAHGVPYIATDSNANAVTRDRRAGHDVYFGDASDAAFLARCGLGEAAGLIITINDQDAMDAIVAHVRRSRPDILIVARAKDASHARHLYAVGASDAVPETIEASLQLSEAALVGLGVPTGSVIATIHEKRDEFRRELQQAANEAGQASSRGVKTKRP